MSEANDNSESTQLPRARSEGLAVPSFAGLYALTGLVALLVLADALLWWAGFDSYRSVGGWNLSFIAAVLGGARFIYHALTDVLDGKLGTDLALALALIAAVLLNEQWVAAEVVLIALIGESLEALTFRRTQQELRKLLELQPARARVERSGESVEIPLEQVHAGDIVFIRPGERIPVDGHVTIGRSSVDQSTLTGESIPVDKEVGSEVYAGTLNQFGALQVRVDRLGADSVLGNVLRMVAEARRNKAEVERLADRLTRYFLPVVLLLAAGTFVVTNAASWRMLIQGESLGATSWEWMPTLAVLVVSCPCALVLATPAAMLAAFAWLARRGVLITGGAALERLAQVTHFVLDKTGTLTQGQLRVAECVGLDGNEATRVLQLAASAEQGSEHLIGLAILTAARDQNLTLLPIAECESLPGAGVRARLGDTQAATATFPWLVGNRRLLVEHGITISSAAEDVLQRLENSGLTTLLVSEQGKLVGVLGVGDTIRSEAPGVLAELRRLGIQDFAVLSGDRTPIVRDVARSVGIERFAGDLRPTEKANWIADWSEHGTAEQPNAVIGRDGSPSAPVCARCYIAMVGDGVNDAPALATADVGIALRGIGSEIAAEAGDVILLGDPLRPLPSVVAIARETVRVIYENVVLFAFLVNFLGIALTAWIMPSWSDAWRQRSPVAAALFHQTGSVLVLLNAMRLLWFERWQRSWLSRWEAWAWNLISRQWEVLAPARAAIGWGWCLRGPRVPVAVLAIVFAYLTQIAVFVQPDEVAVVKRFGRLHSILPPGAHLRLPPPFDSITREQPARVRTLEIGLRRTNADNVAAIEWNSPHARGSLERNQDEFLLMTGDRSLVELAVTIEYRIADLRAFRFGLRDPERLLRAISEGVVRDVVARQPLLMRPVNEASDKKTLDHGLLAGGRSAVEQQIGEQLQQRATELKLGVEFPPSGVCLQDVHPPLAVVDAFRDVSAAYKERERMNNEADAYRRDKLIQAGGERAWRELSSAPELTDARWSDLRPSLTGEAFGEITAAESYAQQQTTLAMGDAQSFLDRNAAHTQQPQLTEWRLFMDTVGIALANRPKLLLDRPGEGRRHLLLGVPPSVVPRLPVIPEPEEE